MANESKTRSQDELFGSFEEEEQIELRADSSNEESGPKGVEPRHVEPRHVEPVLNQELIGLSDVLTSEDSEAIQYCDEAHQMPRHMHQTTVGAKSESLPFDEAEQGYQESTVDSETLDFISANSDPTEVEVSHDGSTNDDLQLAEANDALQLAEANDDLQLAETNDATSTDHELKIHPRHDDSDLLIIEDEVDMHHLDQGQTSKATRPNTIDYKRMLKRMRSKS